MFGFGYALVPMYKRDLRRRSASTCCRCPSAQRRRRRTARRQHAGRHQPHRSPSSSTPTRAGRGTSSRRSARSQVHPGELATVMYEFRNVQNRTMAAQAIPSYAPKQAMAHFNKLECFCFNEYTLKPGESQAVAGGVRHRPEAAEGREDDHPVVHLLRGRRQGAGRAGSGGSTRGHGRSGAHEDRADRRQRPRGRKGSLVQTLRRRRLVVLRRAQVGATTRRTSASSTRCT